MVASKVRSNQRPSVSWSVQDWTRSREASSTLMPRRLSARRMNFASPMTSPSARPLARVSET